MKRNILLVVVTFTFALSAKSVLAQQSSRSDLTVAGSTLLPAGDLLKPDYAIVELNGVRAAINQITAQLIASTVAFKKDHLYLLETQSLILKDGTLSTHERDERFDQNIDDFLRSRQRVLAAIATGTQALAHAASAAAVQSAHIKRNLDNASRRLGAESSEDGTTIAGADAIRQSLMKRSVQADAQAREFGELAEKAAALSAAQHRVLRRTLHVADEGSVPLMQAWKEISPNEKALRASKDTLDAIAEALGWINGQTDARQ